MDVMNQVLQIIIKFCTIGGGLWCVWGVIVLAGALKDKCGSTIIFICCWLKNLKYIL